MGDPTSPGCCTRMTSSVSASARKTKEEVRGVGRDIRDIWNKIELGRRVRSSFTVDNAKDYLPITKWIPKYRFVHQSCVSFVQPSVVFYYFGMLYFVIQSKIVLLLFKFYFS